MFRSSYKYNFNATKNTVTLTPTTGTMVKAFVPAIVVYSAFTVMAVRGAKKANEELQKLMQENQNQE